MTIAGEGDGHQDREVIRQIDAGSIPAGFNLGRDGITDGGCQIAVEAATSSVRLGTQRQGSRSGELRERCAAGLRRRSIERLFWRRCFARDLNYRLCFFDDRLVGRRDRLLLCIDLSRLDGGGRGGLPLRITIW